MGKVLLFVVFTAWIAALSVNAYAAAAGTTRGAGGAGDFNPGTSSGGTVEDDKPETEQPKPAEPVELR